MTHHRNRSGTVGPRRAMLQAKYRRRRQIMAEAPEGFVQVPAIILAARSATRQSAIDKAKRRAGGSGTAPKMTAERRVHVYRLQNYYRGQDASGSRGGPLTVAQARSIRRNATRAELVTLVAKGLATTQELRTYPITEDEKSAWLAAAGVAA
jgi:hypothetical protein